LTNNKSHTFSVNHKTGFFLLLFLLASHAMPLSAQLLDEKELDRAKTYTLEEALKQDPLKVYKLTLKRSKLKQLPSSISQFKNLNSLILNHNKLSIFPHQILTLEYLQELDLSYNELIFIPEKLGKLKHLKILSLQQNHIIAIPHTIGQLKKLHRLLLSNNEITEFPKEINQLKDNLKRLDLLSIPMKIATYKQLKKLLPNTRLVFAKACDCD